MTKRQLIDEIVSRNRSAHPEFLARFGENQLDEYLQHLRVIETPRLNGDPHRFDRYFDGCPTIAVAETPTRASFGGPCRDDDHAHAQGAEHAKQHQAPAEESLVF